MADKAVLIDDMHQFLAAGVQPTVQDVERWKRAVNDLGAEFSAASNTPNRVHEVVEWWDTRLVCGIGHVQTGRVRTVQYLQGDMDGHLSYREPTKQYDPDTCVVCGLKIFRIAPVT